MDIAQPIAAAIVVIGIVGTSDAGAQERATVSNMNLAERYVAGPPRAVRGDRRQPDWVIAPNPQWPEEANDIAEPVTVTSECSVSKAGSLRACRIIAESITDRGFGQAFLRALGSAKVGTSSVPNDGIVFRTTATFAPPAFD